MTKLYTGTAGWSYLKWDKEFYPEGASREEKLAHYASVFNAVELNNTFYQTPKKKQFRDWEKQVPKNFHFAVKASRFITHIKKLKDADKTLPAFFKSVDGQQKAGPVFFQLPPSFPINLDRLESFFAHLPKTRRYAIELRNTSWFENPVYDLLKKYKVALCLFDTPEGNSPRKITTDFCYVRLRGRRGPRLNKFLSEWHEWLSENTKTAYVFFDNREQKDLAFGNALVFRDIAKRL